MGREKDRELIDMIPKEQIADFIFMHLRNMWAVDGLYYLGIEQKYGTEIATEIDCFVWNVMGKIEARRIKELFKIKDNAIQGMMQALQYSGWALDLEDKEIILEDRKAILRNTKCRVQETRIEKGLKEFACKPVRKGFLESFAKEINPDIQVKCKVCPPDDHSDDLWCAWEFSL